MSRPPAGAAALAPVLHLGGGEWAPPRSRLRFRVQGLLHLCLMLMGVAQLGRIPVMSAGAKDAPLYVHDLGMGLLVCAAALCLLRSQTVRIDGTTRFALLFGAVGAVSAVMAGPRFGLTPFELVFSLAYLVRWLAYFCVYVVVVNYVRGAEGAWSVWRVLQGTVAVFAAFGLFQVAFLPNFAQLVYPSSVPYQDWDVQGHRLVSTLLDPNFAGALLVIVLLPSLGMLVYGARVRYPVLALLLVALLLTLSRGSLLGFAVGACVLVAARGLSPRMVRLGLMAVPLLLAAAPAIIHFGMQYNKFKVDASALTRLVGWARCIDLLMQYPVLGVGFNTLGFVQRRVYAAEVMGNAAFGLDGGLLLIAVLTGGVGLVLYLGMVGTLLARCRRVWRNRAAPGPERGFAAGVAAATVAMLVQGFFINTLLAPFLIFPLWTLWGLVSVLHDSRRDAAAAERPA